MENEWRIELNGKEYIFESNYKGTHYSIYCVDNRYWLSDCSCAIDANPAVTLWQDYRYSTLRGAARNAYVQKYFKKVIESEIEQHIIFCHELLENGDIDKETGKDR